MTETFPPPRIDTARLILRVPQLKDAPAALEQWCRHAEVARFMLWRAHQHLTVTREFLQSTIDAWALDAGHRVWLLERKADGVLLGSVGISASWPRGEIGYALGPAHWGAGYMSEAVHAVCDAAFSLPTRNAIPSSERFAPRPAGSLSPALARVQALVDVENERSAALLTRLGFRAEGTLARYAVHPNVSAEPRDVRIFACLHGELHAPSRRVAGESSRMSE